MESELHRQHRLISKTPSPPTTLLGEMVYFILFAESEHNLNFFYYWREIVRRRMIIPLSENCLFPGTEDIFGVYNGLPLKIRNFYISIPP